MNYDFHYYSLPYYLQLPIIDYLYALYAMECLLQFFIRGTKLSFLNSL